MRAENATDTVDMTLAGSGYDHITVQPKPRLLLDNGTSYNSGKLADISKPPR